MKEYSVYNEETGMIENTEEMQKFLDDINPKLEKMRNDGASVSEVFDFFDKTFEEWSKKDAEDNGLL